MESSDRSENLNCDVSPVTKKVEVYDTNGNPIQMQISEPDSGE